MKSLFYFVAVSMLFAAAQPLHAQDNVLDAQDIAEPSDEFGAALAAGDFNKDGFPDLAVGIPGEDLGDIVDAGAVEVFYGSADGLAPEGRQFWHKNNLGLNQNDIAETEDLFGAALAAGDFNGDNFDDLVIGIPNNFVRSGRIIVLFGSEDGLTAVDLQSRARALGGGTGDKRYGSALAAGDFDGDGFADVAVGEPKLDIGGKTSVGQVEILYGSGDGLSLNTAQQWNQDSEGISDNTEALDEFGASLSAADFNDDGFSDLAIGVPGEGILQGGVHVLYGSADGLTATDSQEWRADTPEVAGEAAQHKKFGEVLSAGDFNGDGFYDLAIGAPRDDLDTGDTNANRGGVHIIYGSDDGLVIKSGFAKTQFWQQGADGLEDLAEDGDFFGSSLSAGDFNNDGMDDLAIGVFREDGRGAIHVLHGSEPLGLQSDDDQLWVAENGSGVPLSSNELGSSLAVADFDADGAADLAAGAADRSTIDGGAVNVIYGLKKDGLGAKRLQLWRQPLILALDDEATMDEDGTVIIQVDDNDLQAFTVTRSITIPNGPLAGTLEAISGQSLGTYRYRPNSDFNGTEQFTYSLQAQRSINGVPFTDETIAQVSISVLPVNDAPDFETNGNFVGSARSGLLYEERVLARDVDGDALTFQAVAKPAWLQITDEGNGAALFAGTPSDADLGEHGVTLQVSDGQAQAEKTFTVTVGFGEPAVPALAAPEDATEGLALPPDLVWNAAFGASMYRVQVTTATDFSFTLIDTTGIADTTFVAEGLEPGKLYFWRVQAINDLGGSAFSGAFRFSTALNTAVDEEVGVPLRFVLHGNYPNPFNPVTTLAFELPQASVVRLLVYDMLGREAVVLVDERLPAGRHEAVFDAARLPSGVYIYRLEAGSFVQMRMMTLLK